MDRLSQDIRHALARLVRDRGFAAITIVTLALGIGANTAVFSLVKAALLSPLPYGDADRLTVIWGPDRGGDHAPVAAGGVQLSARNAELRRHRGLPGIRRELHRRAGAGAGARRLGDAEPVRGHAHAGDDRPRLHAGGHRRRIERRHRHQPRPVAAALRRQHRHPRADGAGERPRAHDHRRDAGVVQVAERLSVAAADRSVGARSGEPVEPRRLGQPFVLGTGAPQRRCQRAGGIE